MVDEGDRNAHAGRGAAPRGAALPVGAVLLLALALVVHGMCLTPHAEAASHGAEAATPHHVPRPALLAVADQPDLGPGEACGSQQATAKRSDENRVQRMSIAAGASGFLPHELIAQSSLRRLPPPPIDAAVRRAFLQIFLI